MPIAVVIYPPLCAHPPFHVCADCLDRSLDRRDCDPATYTDPADLRSEPVEEEFDLEYLVYGLFERPDRPDGAFLSKRWVPFKQLLEAGGLGNLETKIGVWEESRKARERATVEAAFEAAEKAAEKAAGSDSVSDSGSDSGSDSEEAEGEERGDEGEERGATLAQMCERGSKRLRAGGAEMQEVPLPAHELACL